MRQYAAGRHVDMAQGTLDFSDKALNRKQTLNHVALSLKEPSRGRNSKITTWILAYTIATNPLMDRSKKVYMP